MRAQANHGLNSEGHTCLTYTGSLALGVMRHTRASVEELIDTVANVGLDDAASLDLSVLFDHVAEFPDGCARFHKSDGLAQAFARSFGDADRIRVGPRGADIIRLVQIAMEALVVDSHVDIQDVAIDQDTAVRDAVTDNFIGRRAHRLGKVHVIQRRRVSLYKPQSAACCLPSYEAED